MLYHLRTKVDFDPVLRVGNDLLRRHAIELLPTQVEVVVDLHLRPYYGDEAETAGLYHSEAKAGTTAFHAYATLYARVRTKRYTLAIRRVTDGDTASDVLAEFLAVLEGLEVGVEAIYLDREFYERVAVALDARLTRCNPAMISRPPTSCGQPIRSPRNRMARSDADSGCSVV